MMISMYIFVMLLYISGLWPFTTNKQEKYFNFVFSIHHYCSDIGKSIAFRFVARNGCESRRRHPADVRDSEHYACRCVSSICISSTPE